MRLDQLAGLWCVSCGRADDGTFVKLAKSVWPNARVCARCLGKYAVTALSTAADQTLARATPTRTRCHHCGQPHHTAGLWCHRCEAERRRLVA